MEKIACVYKEYWLYLLLPVFVIYPKPLICRYSNHVKQKYLSAILSDQITLKLWNLLTACDRSCLSHLPRQYTGLLSPTVKQQMQQQQYWDYSFYISSGWPKFAYVTNPVPPETRCVTYKLHSLGRSFFHFFLYFR